MKTEQAIYDPGLPKLKFPEPKPNPVERILNMDEETFRRLINMPKIQKVTKTGRSGDSYNCITDRNHYNASGNEAKNKAELRQSMQHMPRDTQEHAEMTVDS